MPPPAALAAAERVRAASAAAPKPPTRELGAPAQPPLAFGMPAALSSGFGLTDGLLEQTEYADAWRWPTAGTTVERMRNDSQVDALYTMVALSIRRRRWLLEPNGARDVIVEGLAQDLGLPIRGQEPQPRARARGRFSWDRHVAHVLLGLLYGHYFFEQVGEIVDGQWRLRKLAPRPPRTIDEIRIDQGGGLAGIVQPFADLRNGEPRTLIPVDRLVAYVWDQEGSAWRGRSMLRSLFREYDIKDRLIKVDALKHQRNGMGVPVGRITDQSVAGNAAVLADLQRMATAMRAGEDAGGSLPFGTDIDLKGVQGTLPDTLASIRRCDEAMARRWMQMWAMLGQTETGSRALGDSFTEKADQSNETIALWIADTTTDHVCEDWVDFNYGPGEQLVPQVVSEATESAEATISRVLDAVQRGAIVMDPELEAWLRSQLGLPERAGPLPPAPSAARGARRSRRPAAAATADHSAVTLPDRPLRRDANIAEAAAGVDFAAIEQAYVDAVDELVAGLNTLRETQIADLVAQVRQAGDDLEALAQIATDPVGAEQLAASMRAMAASGVQDALSEARHQGVQVDAIDLDALEGDIVARAAAAAQTLAADVSNTAAKAATRLVGATSLAGDLADSVGTYLGALKWQAAEVTARGVLQGSFNAGRFGQFDEAEQQAATTTRYYHSALLDQNTCGPCADVDGTEYVDLQDVEASFAGTGGYALCDGAERCRCTAVAVYDEAAPSLQ